MAYSFDAFLAADPSNPANIAANAAITIFDPADPTHAPVTITDLTGLPLANPVTVNKNGFGPAFMHETLDRVGWAGGGFEGLFTSYEGMKAEAVAARVAAENAAADAGAEAAAVADAAIGDATAEATAAAASANAASNAAAASATAAANSAALVGAPADTAIAAAINGSGTATKAALSATYAPASGSANYASTAALAAKAGIADVNNAKASRVFRLACLGNSLYDGTGSADTNVYDTNPETIYTDTTWYNLALNLSMGKLVRGGNFGIGGQTTAQVVARVNDVLNASPRPTACVLGEGTNTIGGGADDAASLAAADTLISGADQLAAGGIIPVLMNCPPRGSAGVPKTDDERRRVALYNTRLARLAALRGYPLIDVHKVTVDPSTGKFLEVATTDGVHYTRLYNRKVAEAALNVLLPMAGGYEPFLANWNADPTNLITNGLFLGSTSTVASYPMPAGWNGGTGNFRAITAPVAGDNIKGNWFDLWKDAAQAAATATDYTSLSPSIAAGTSTFAVGDRMRWAFRYRIEDIENTVNSSAGAHLITASMFVGGANINVSPVYQYTINVSDALAVVEFTVPAAATTLQPQLGIAGQGKLRVAQMTLRNLTKLGAV